MELWTRSYRIFSRADAPSAEAVNGHTYRPDARTFRCHPPCRISTSSAWPGAPWHSHGRAGRSVPSPRFSSGRPQSAAGPVPADLDLPPPPVSSCSPQTLREPSESFPPSSSSTLPPHNPTTESAGSNRNRTARNLTPQANSGTGRPHRDPASLALPYPTSRPRRCRRSPSRPPPWPHSSRTLLLPRRRPRPCPTSPSPSTSRARSTPPGRRRPPRRRRRTTPSTSCPKSSRHSNCSRKTQIITPEALANVKTAIANSEKDKKVEANKKAVPRKAAGQCWEDPMLAGWPENDFRLFCGDLGNEVNDDVLTKAFSKYPSFNMARVIRDKWTGKTKGYGFVSFANASDLSAALKEMNGKYVGNRLIKLRKSTWKNRIDYEALQKPKTQPQKKLKVQKRSILHK